MTKIELLEIEFERFDEFIRFCKNLYDTLNKEKECKTLLSDISITFNSLNDINCKTGKLSINLIKQLLKQKFIYIIVSFKNEKKYKRIILDLSSVAGEVYFLNIYLYNNNINERFIFYYPIQPLCYLRKNDNITVPIVDILCKEESDLEKKYNHLKQYFKKQEDKIRKIDEDLLSIIEIWIKLIDFGILYNLIPSNINWMCL